MITVPASWTSRETTLHEFAISLWGWEINTASNIVHHWVTAASCIHSSISAWFTRIQLVLAVHPRSFYAITFQRNSANPTKWRRHSADANSCFNNVQKITTLSRQNLNNGFPHHNKLLPSKFIYTRLVQNLNISMTNKLQQSHNLHTLQQWSPIQCTQPTLMSMSISICIHRVPKKHVTTFSTITLTISVRLQ